MARSLPERPTVAALQAEISTTTTELVVAERYGFPDWATLVEHVAEIERRTWVSGDPPRDEPVADTIVRLACLTFEGDDPARRVDAARLLRENPGASSIALAAVTADVDALRGFSAMNDPTGPFGWSPLMYAAYSRLEVHPDAAAATTTLLLDAGADPNDGYYFSGYPTPFTVLTGVFGGGELDQPPHPHASTLARILLDAGADPNDGQTLYNRMFGDADDFLEILFPYGLGSGDGGPWRRRLPHLTPSPPDLVRNLLHWAVIHDQRRRVRLLASHGVDISASFTDGALPVEVALRSGHTELAAILRGLGSPEPELTAEDTFVAAALAGDTDVVRRTPADVVDRVRSERPGLIVWATGQGKPDAIPLLQAAGFDIDAFARSDLPIEQPWQTALHTAVERRDVSLVRLLLGLGADPTLRDVRFGGTPADWAGHFGHTEIAIELGSASE